VRSENPPPTLAVGAIVIHDDSLLMVRRGHEPNKGLWTVPGGRVEAGEYLSDALRREVREETGIDIEVGDLLGILEVAGEEHFVILDFLAQPLDDATPSASDDAAEARWVPLRDVAKLDCTPRFVDTLRGWGIPV
jgi:ADP-ribose pyrophosphatase YjhB (NUDIX family)